MKLTGNYELREMAGEFVLMPKGQFLLDGKKPMIINDVVADLIEKIGEGIVDDKLYQYVVGEYGIDMETALSDVGEMLEDLRQKEIVDEC